MHTHNYLNDKNFRIPSGLKNLDIDEILRGEISAKEAYQQVLEKVEDDPEAYRLNQFKLDHENAVRFWKKQAKQTGVIPEKSSSIWGTVVETFVGASKIIGEETALRALKKGEEHGLSHYQKMLESDMLTDFQKSEIRKTFIPRQSRHIESINTMIKQK